MSSRAYVPEVDGLRAFAVAAVLLFHAFPAWCTGGYIGVDVFFTISGFVICRTYLWKLVDRETTLKSFYLKRVRRLAPAYVAVLFATTLAAYFIPDPRLLRNYGESLLAQPFYAQNFTFWIEGDYFDKAYSKPLLHTWSLAVEEQFYLLFGLLIAIGRWKRSLLLPLIAAAIVLSFAAGHLISGSSPKTSFYLLPTRVWEFGAGVCAYLVTERLPRRPGSRVAHAAFVLSAALLAVAVFAFGETSRFPGAHSVIACAATATLLVLFDTRPSPFYRAFRAAPMRRGGELSYSLYLWHWPAIVVPTMLLRRPLTVVEASTALVLSFVLSEVSYRWIETPIRSRDRLASSRALFTAWATSSLALIAIGAVLITTRGALFRYSEPVRTLLTAVQDRSPYRCSYRFRVTNPRAEMCPLNEVRGGAGVLIIGDSHADQIDELVADLGRERSAPVFLAVRSCDIDQFNADAYCSGAVLAKILREAKDHGVTRVVATSYWVDADVRREHLGASVQAFVDAGLDVYLSEVVPNGPFFDPALRAAALLGQSDPRTLPPEYGLEEYLASIRGQRAVFDQLAGVHQGHVHVLRPVDHLCSPRGCEFTTDGYPNYFDEHHVTPTGARRLRPMYARVFEER